MTFYDMGMIGELRVIGSDDLPPGQVYAFNPEKLKRQLGLFPYQRTPKFRFSSRYELRTPQTDDMRQMLDDIEAAR